MFLRYRILLLKPSIVPTGGLLIEMERDMRVAVLGASPKKDRYANKAIHMLQEYNHEVVPVNPAFDVIEEIPCEPSLGSIKGDIDTLTLYVNPKRGLEYLDEIIALKPKRVIMNPGTESDEIAQKLEEIGVEVVQACTLVMLRTGQF